MKTLRAGMMGSSIAGYPGTRFASGLPATNTMWSAALGNGKPTRQAVLDAFSPRIEKGSTISHDREQAHDPLVEILGLKSLQYDAREIKKLPDSENPLNQVNQYCRLLKLFLKAYSGFIRDDMQDYLNLYFFIMNPPNDKHLKVENFMNLAFDCRILHRYRD
ncbi:MAG: hypothetical protein EOM45_08885 [Clostridia bacterium]|nr:hypothetical protein [Clostridia bacterium]